MSSQSEAMTIPIAGGDPVDGLLVLPPQARACFVFGHGAGAGMRHGFMEAFATGLAERRLASLRYQFPFMQQESRRPDRPAVAHGAVRAAVHAAAKACAGLPLLAGGKSFGGRMTSQAQAERPLEGVRGLAFVGFPLHPEGKPSDERAEHLDRISVPMLFLQGTRDGLADLALLQPVCERLGQAASLVLLDDADHSFHVRARSGRTDAETSALMLDAFSDWAQRACGL